MMIVAYRIDSRIFLIFVRISWFYHFIVRLTRINVGALQKSLQLVIVRFWLVSTQLLRLLVKSLCGQMKAIKYGCAPIQINFPSDESR